LPPEAAKYEADFVNVISKIKRRHDPVVTTVAKGILEYKEYRKQNLIDTNVQAFLDRFYLSRIGIRMLIGQHIALNSPSKKDYVGVICTRTNVRQIAQDAIDNARFICEDYYGLFASPQVNLYCSKELHFMYVPSHLHHMIFELLKNSLRAVVELNGVDCDNYPAINLIVAEGEEVGFNGGLSILCSDLFVGYHNKDFG
jgi:pyruvate dehydrogenase kinase 2/3/4